MKSLIIIPSVRNPNVISSYANNALAHNFDLDDLFFLILTEDFSDKLAYTAELERNSLRGLILNQKDREAFLNDNGLQVFNDLIPKRSHAETSFGLIYLWLHREYDYAFLIDDDTEPEPIFDYFGDHIRNLNFSGEITEVSSDKQWINVLYQNYDKYKLYPRGYPYSKIGERIEYGKTEIKKGDIWISQGLWTNVPDLDAIRILMDGDLNGQSRTRLSTSDFVENFVVKKYNFLTVCSMNLAIRREVIPFFYQFPMDDNPWKIGRFDDIWSGLVAKKVLDHIDKHIMTGFPLCKHNKAPRSTFKDVRSEAPGYESNELFWRVLSKISLNGTTSISEMSRKLGKELSVNDSTDFIRYCGSKFAKWVEGISGR